MNESGDVQRETRRARTGDGPVATANMPDPLLRLEVLACQHRADELRGQADEAYEGAVFWASLITDCCDGVQPCEHPLCYEAWRQYPDG